MAWSDKARQAAAETRRRHATHPTGGTPNHKPTFTNEYGQTFVKPYGQHTGHKIVGNPGYKNMVKRGFR